MNDRKPTRSPLADITMIRTSAEFDAHLAAQRSSKKILDRNIQRWQAELGPGDHAFFIFVPRQQEPLCIYYEVIPVAHPEDRALFRQCPERILIKGFSQVEPHGEIGTVHRASLWWPISLDDWHRYDASGWPDISQACQEFIEQIRRDAGHG